MTSQQAADAAAEDAKRPPLAVVTRTRVYTWPGQHPHAPGTALKLPYRVAMDLIEGEHVERPEDRDARLEAEAKAAREKAAEQGDA